MLDYHPVVSGLARRQRRRQPAFGFVDHERHFKPSSSMCVAGWAYANSPFQVLRLAQRHRYWWVVKMG